MRLRSDIWVKAYVRTCAANGASAYVVHHGDDAAGAIFIKVTGADRYAELYGPAPAGLDSTDLDRRFVRLTVGGAIGDREADTRLAREREFDSDVWIVEIEDRHGRHFLEQWLVE